MATAPKQANLGYFLAFMQDYGRADAGTRAELYRDTQAYSHGAETATVLYGQVYELLGVPVVSPQVYGGAI